MIDVQSDYKNVFVFVKVSYYRVDGTGVRGAKSLWLYLLFLFFVILYRNCSIYFWLCSITKLRFSIWNQAGWLYIVDRGWQSRAGPVFWLNRSWNGLKNFNLESACSISCWANNDLSQVRFWMRFELETLCKKKIIQWESLIL